MTDYYALLGVTPRACPAEIRAAYLARMKVLHPDVSRTAGAFSASDITLAYWTLRDPDRRADYDAAFAGTLSRSRAVAPSRARMGQHVPARRPAARTRHYRARLAHCEKTRRRAGAAMLMVTAIGLASSLAYLQLYGSGRAAAASIATHAASVKSEKPLPRSIDQATEAAAAAEFRSLLREGGFIEAELYGRQCYAELAAFPTLRMVDYCLAFDRTAAQWQRALSEPRRSTGYFDDQQRLARYRRIGDAVANGEVRSAFLAEAGSLMPTES